ncbi:MAG: 50S ribosomal protein L6 [Gemmatimonadetes bacterium]|nr:50S ribosomal protein L6 [Gemmatimonadota bacterium]
MSRIGKKPVNLPKGVDVSVKKQTVRVKGPKGDLTMNIHPALSVKVDAGTVVVERPSDSAQHKALHGLTRTLIANMVGGVTEGYQRALEIVGVGYKAERSGKGIKLSVGFSHTVQYDAPAGVTIETPNPTTVIIKGADKQMVGQVASEIRAVQPPEPYKGKGIRYQGEQVRRKAGKTAGA